MAASTLDSRHYTVAWLAPLEIEARAALAMLDERHEGRFAVGRGDDYLYYAGDMCGHNIIIATFPADSPYGTGSAGALAGQVKKSFPNLWFGLLVGVAAGLPNPDRSRDIRLGDVLVGVGERDSAGIVSYGLGREEEQGFELLNGGYALAKTESILRAAIGKLRNAWPDDRRLFLPYYERVKNVRHRQGTFQDPGQDKDHLMSEGAIVERQAREEAERTQVWYGPIGSGDKLMKNAQERDRYRDKYGLIGLEMEAAGTMNTINVAVIRGVCDYGDKQKNKEWQPYAAAMAAAFAKAILTEIPPSTNSREEARGKCRVY